MRLVAAATLMLAMSMSSSLEAGASDDDAAATTPKVRAKEVGTILVEDDRRAATATAPSTPQIRRVGHLPPPTVYSYWALEWFGNDSFCLRRRATTNAAVARGAADARWYRAFAEANGGVYAECPPRDPGERRERTPPEVADGLARDFWAVRVLPDPVLRVVPDYAITGKLVYLQISGPKDHHFDVDNPIGDDVAITATSQYLVDWGDGTRATTASQGGPWPSGDVTHTYVETAPTRTITVKQVWTAGWTAGLSRGTLTDLQTTSTLDLPVTQLQAVRNS